MQKKCKMEPALNVLKEKKMKIKDMFKKDIVKDILTNIIYLILVVIYFIIFNTQASLLDLNTQLKYIDISSITFLFISYRQ